MGLYYLKILIFELVKDYFLQVFVLWIICHIGSRNSSKKIWVPRKGKNKTEIASCLTAASLQGVCTAKNAI